VPTSDDLPTSEDLPSVSIAVNVAGLDPDHLQVFTQTLNAAAAAGYEFDQDCLLTAVEKLSSADAKLIVAAGPNGDPTLSAEGEQLGTEIGDKCLPDLSTGTTGS
jgi:hypothetical protein